uniref:Uncharacterized protein n=1 Tax=Phaeocystis antarctica TaxID=33657 RepID=A0A7S0NC85_9EUKA
MRSAALLCVLAASLDTAAAYQLTSRGGSRRDVLKAFVATAPLFAAANSASAGTVGAAPTPEDEAKFDVIFAQKLEEKKVMFAKMGYEVEEEDKKELEYLLRTSLCGFQAKLKCKGSGKPPKSK